MKKKKNVVLTYLVLLVLEEVCKGAPFPFFSTALNQDLIFCVSKHSESYIMRNIFKEIHTYNVAQNNSKRNWYVRVAQL